MNSQPELEVEAPGGRPRPTQRGYRTLLRILTTAAERRRELEEAA
jgi:hypothetical protein